MNCNHSLWKTAIIIFTVALISGCNFQESELSKKVNPFGSTPANEALKEQLIALIPCEKINVGYSNYDTTFGIKEAVTYTFMNPRINIDNDTLMILKSKKLAKIVRREAVYLDQYDGFSLIFNNEKVVNDSIMKEHIVTYKFNSRN
ncbi:MAG: hypothetical protein WBG46_05645 [Nonlabens sp.]